jgi:DNA-binding response OmpR family regulator/nitrogen-specific signal transduction histidine kinase
LTWWAKGAYVLLFIGSIWGFIYLRTQRQKKELENMKRINTRLQQIDKLKDQFLANTSHELRTPLQGIIGLSESVMDGIGGKLSAQVTDILRMITTSGKRLSYLINDILDFSRLRNQELTLQQRPVDLHAAADVVLTLASPLVRNKEIALINEVSRDTPFVEADENRLQQILQNLVGNAIKFTDKGEVKISAVEKDDKITMTVTDTGIGIPKEKWNDVFKAFEQADGSTAREYGGTGIGLSITKQLVELHGGKIWLSSKVREGSQFSFTLPLSDIKRKEKPELDFARGLEETKSIIEKGSTEETVEEEKVEGGSEEIQAPVVKQIPEPDQIKILVVDDEPVNLEVLKNHLSLAGYQVTLANNGLDAMEIIEKGETFDLMILDIMMPKMSGYEVCNKLRDIYMPSELPVVLLTAKNRITDLVDGFNAGANDYLTKPFSKDELLSRIKIHLQLHRINKVTGKFVPYEFLRFIGRESIMDVKLGDQKEQEVSVLFTDIRDYTTLSEDMTPDENFRFINSFAGRMGPIIHQHKGFINQYMGDAIMAIFPREVENGLKASIEMQRGIIDYNEYRRKKDRKNIEIGIGLHTGPLMMGIIGDQNRTEPATIADTVNIASRMEGMTKYYGIKILISQDSHNILTHPDEYHFRYMGEIVVKGKKLPVKVYECFDGDIENIRDKKLDSLKDFEEGLRLYYNKEFPEASVIFNQIVKDNPDDKAAAYLYNKAVTYALKGVPDDWTGVEKMDMK